jgi:PRTRC genetic system protein E
METTTNFFNQIAQLQIIGDLHITISKGAEGRLIVLVMLQNEACGDSAKHTIPPLNLRGTAEELDSGFFENITTPITVRFGSYGGYGRLYETLEDTKKQSAMEKEKADSQKKEQEAKDKKFSEAMAKADELEKDGKFREAWIKVPEIHEFPFKAEEIRRRKSELSAKFAPDLFGSTTETAKPEPPREALFPEYANDSRSKSMKRTRKKRTQRTWKTWKKTPKSNDINLKYGNHVISDTITAGFYTQRQGAGNQAFRPRAKMEHRSGTEFLCPDLSDTDHRQNISPCHQGRCGGVPI